jgi:hypothetical protein
VPQVLAAGRYGETLVFFHDDWTTPEPEGFWVHGRRPTQITMAGPSDAPGPATFRLRADYAANHVTISAPGWIRELDLPPGEPQVLELPPASRGVVSLTIVTTGGFVPAERDPSVRDQRLLGAWVDFER